MTDARVALKTPWRWPNRCRLEAEPKAVNSMHDDRIEAFLKDVLALEGDVSYMIRDSARRHLAICEKLFRDAESDKRSKDEAVQSCRMLCRELVIKEIRQRKGTPTAEHLKIVLAAIEELGTRSGR